MTSLRDIQVGSDVSLMDKLGRFDRDIVVYGLAFREQGMTQYLVTSRAERLYHLTHNSAMLGVLPTMVGQRLKSLALPAGTQTDMAWQAKIALAAELQSTYGAAFWQVLEAMAQGAATDDALPLLRQWQEQLLGCFERETLDLFAGFLSLALAQKTLSQVSYQQFQGWLGHIYRQLEDDVCVKKAFRRTFSGFAYQEPGKGWRYFTDGQPQTVWARQAAETAKGRWVTPVWQKTYWFAASTPVRQVAVQFEQELAARLDEIQLARAESLWQLPAALPADALVHLLKQAPEAFNQQERQTLRAYGYCYRAVTADILAIIGADQADSRLGNG